MFSGILALNSGIPTTIWEQGGITIHLGGIEATRRLLARSPLRPGQRVLDLGCGTGYTAVTLAKQRECGVTALDVTWRSLLEAKARAVRSNVSLDLTQGDAHNLPFTSELFAGVVIESLLLFCDAPRVLGECYRVLQPGGWLGMNEMTLQNRAPPGLAALLQEIGVGSAREAADWADLLAAVGFVNLETAVFPFRFGEQFRSHLQVDGLRGYLASAIRNLRQTAVRRTFVNRQMIQAFRQFRPLIGYGLFLAWKPAPSGGAANPHHIDPYTNAK